MNQEASAKLRKASATRQVGDLPFFGHLEELRSRLIMCLFAIGAAFLLTLFAAKPILHFLMQPLLKLLKNQSKGQLYFTGLAEPLITQLKVAFFAAILLAFPVIFYQLWKFVSPGLYRDEKKSILGLTAFTVGFFLAGIAFAYYVIFPMSFQFFLSYGTNDIRPLLTISTYLHFAIQLLLAFGLIFELPLVILVLTWSGVLEPKQILQFWRYAIVLIAIFSAILTPPDVASMMLMMAPMTGLYFIGVGLAYLFGRRTEKISDSEPAPV